MAKKKGEEKEEITKEKKGRKRGREKDEGSKKEEGGEEKKAKRRRGSKASQQPATPPVSRPVRERKSVERYTFSLEKSSSASKVVSVQKGRGLELKEIPNVAYRFSKRKFDDNLLMLHMILFGRKSKKNQVKRNLSQFSGFVWTDDEEKQRAKVKEKIDKCVKERLFDFCELLDIPVSKSSKKEELSAKLLEFLESPHATTEVSLAEQDQKGKRKRTAKGNKESSPGEGLAESSVKKQKKSHEASVKKGRKKDSTVKERVKSEDEDETTGSAGASEEEDDDAIPAESDHGEGRSEEDEEKEKEHDRSRKSSAKKQVKGSETKAKGKPAAVKKSSTSKSSKSQSKSSKSSQKEESDHPRTDSGKEEDEQKEHMDSKTVSRKKPVKGSTAKKEKAAHVKQDSVEKSVKAPSKSVRRRGVNVSSSRTTSKSKGKGHSGEKEVQKKSKGSRSSSSNEKKTRNKQTKSGLKISAKEQTGKGKALQKARVVPSRQQMLTAVSDILKEVDFNTATLSDILRQLEDVFEVDLSHEQEMVKSVIEEAMENMTDEEEEEENSNDDPEEEDNAGDDAEEGGKDDDDDDDE